MTDDRATRITRIVAVAAGRLSLDADSAEALAEYLMGVDGSLSNAAEYWAHMLVMSDAPDVCGDDDAYLERNRQWIESVGREIGYAARGW